MRLYEENGVAMAEETTKGGTIIKRFYSAIDKIVVEFDGGILIVKYDDAYNIDYVGEIEMYVNDIYVSRETIVTGVVKFDLSQSDVGEYVIVLKVEGLEDCEVNYEKN